ncbi:MAG: hypothetical protein LUC91_00600 [Prevotella sp.]|nr:hypothetical protein [Prevotella sp.]
MTIDTKSPEFVNAWRLVSEALLEHIQQCGPMNSESIINSVPVMKTAVENPISSSRPEKNIQESDIRYAACAIRQTDGSYKFKNLKEEEQEESTYKITRYADGSCEFELCNLQGEARQVFKDNRAYRMPEAVGKSTGEITADNSIVTIRRGRGEVDGRSVKILEPLIVEFK